MIVCVAEKPSVASEIAKILGATLRKDGYFEGNGYQVTWTFGHLCCLKSPEEYDISWKKWSLDILPMIPVSYETRIIKDSGIKKQFKIIKALYAKADSIINCGDAGQEGELIQRWVMENAHVKCPVQRLWISSLTEESIRKGFQDLKPQSNYDSLYQAGLARAEGDWLLGMNATRLYTVKFGGYKQVLSIGRVQTPTLAMIVDRDTQISHFRQEPYWVLTTKYRNVIYTATKGKFNSLPEGNEVLASLDKKFTIIDIQENRGVEQPPQLYDLTSLQVDCNKRYGMSAEQTLKTIQSLYEKKLTTYPRVDTKFLTDDIYVKCPQILKGLENYSSLTAPIYGNKLPKSKRVFNDSKVTDHHAIIPTGVKPKELTERESSVYDLICRRFIAVFYPDCHYATTTVVGHSGQLEFKVTGKRVIREGWHIIYVAEQKIDEEEENSVQTPLPPFSIGESGPHLPLLMKKMTTPPKRYTEASLLQAMETAGKMVEDETLREAMKENGIGRPSSRAGIIETLLKRNYIQRDKKNLVSTQAGRDLINTIHVNLLKSPELTGRWEKKLRDIESGHYHLSRFMEELEEQLNDIISDVCSDTSGRQIGSSSTVAKPDKTFKRKSTYKK